MYDLSHQPLCGSSPSVRSSCSEASGHIHVGKLRHGRGRLRYGDHTRASAGPRAARRAAVVASSGAVQGRLMARGNRRRVGVGFEVQAAEVRWSRSWRHEGVWEEAWWQA